MKSLLTFNKMALNFLISISFFILFSCKSKSNSDESPSPTPPAETVAAELEINPKNYHLFYQEKVKLTAQGGKEPYVWSLVPQRVLVGPQVSEPLDPNTGEFRAPSVTGSFQIQVQDADGKTAEGSVSVADQLKFSIDQVQISFRQNLLFKVTGGFPPYQFSILQGDSTVNSSTGLVFTGTTDSDVIVGVTDSAEKTSEARLSVVGLSQIVSGGSSSCVIDRQQNLRCWGLNNKGQLGTENTVNYGSSAFQMGIDLPFVNLGQGRKVKNIALGQTHACAILDNDFVKCWGANSYGQLGLGSTQTYGDQKGSMADALPYVNLGTDRKARRIFAGHFFSCAILDNDGVKCWGQNNVGQLGIGSTENKGTSPSQMGDQLPYVHLGSQSQVTSLALGYFHACALFANGRLKCWGQGSLGQHGLGHSRTIGTTANTLGDALPYVDLGTGRTATALAAGLYHTCALLDNGGVKCWGRNNFGQLGLGSTVNRGTSPSHMGNNLPFVQFGSALRALSLSANYDSTCALLIQNENKKVMKCWGLNSSGELGIENIFNIGSTTQFQADSWSPVLIENPDSNFQFSTGRNFACSLWADKGIKCWGKSQYGALGNGSTTPNVGDELKEMGDALPFLAL